MTITTTDHVSTRHRRTFLGSVAALAVALTVGLGAGPASATTTDITSGHIDFVSVNWSGTGLILGSNYEDTEWEPAGTYDVVVPYTTAPSGYTGNGYILPETQAESTARGVPYAGFSGDEQLRALTTGHYVAGDTITLTLTGVSFTPKTSGTGTVAISQGGTAWFTSATSYAHTFTVTGTVDEVFHQHTKWVFSNAGTYVLTFTATGSHGSAAASQSYTFKVGL